MLLPYQRYSNLLWGMNSAFWSKARKTVGFCLLACLVALGATTAYAQVAGSGTIQGVVLDPSGAIVPGATVTIHNPVSGYARSAETDSQGQFNFPNVPFDSYHLTVKAQGFAAQDQYVEVRSRGTLSLTETVPPEFRPILANCR